MSEVKRTKKGQFAKGHSGNPRGRASSYNAMLKQQLNEQAEAVIDVVVQAALNGDMQAAKLILDRVLPPLKAILPTIEVKGFKKKGEVLNNAQAVLYGIAKGEISPDLGAQLIQSMMALSGNAENQLHTMEVVIFEGEGGL